MRKSLLITAISLIAVGALLFTVALAALDFDFSKLSTVKYETNTYEVSGDFDKISIDVTTTQIVFAQSEDENCKIVCHETEKVKHSAAVQDGTLVIDTVDTRKWYDHIGISFGGMKMTVYLPHDEYAALLVNTDTGDVVIPKDFTFESISVDSDTADIACYASTSKNIEISTDTGKIKVDGVCVGEMNLRTETGTINVQSVNAAGAVVVEVDTGKVQLTDVECKEITAESDTGDITFTRVTATEKLRAETSTGDVKFENSDAASILVKTNTGDVTGTLRSEKVFICETATGDIDVPKTTSGGKCEITTDTGDIELSII